MTYELPDEAAIALEESLAKIIEVECPRDEFGAAEFFRAGVTYALPILAAHFERSGAEKMREAAAQVADRYAPVIQTMTQVVQHDGRVPDAIRALPLPVQHDSQTTNDTEEATNA